MRQRKIHGERKDTCCKCGKEVEESRRGQGYCKSCHAESMRKNRPTHSELTADQRKRANARSYFNVYLNRGKIKKEPCCVCGEVNSQAHHNDYDKPLEVKWYCKKHHTELHLMDNSKKPTMTTEEAIEKFRLTYPSTSVMVYDDYLVYKVHDGVAKLASNQANELIQKLELPLVAIPTKLFRKDSFSVKLVGNKEL